MRYGVILSTGDPRAVADLAREAETAGWDGAFYWDAIAIPGPEIYDPWVVMAAMAMATRRVRLGAIITPLSRRRPWKVAREATTLDHLSNGRLILSVGLGALDDLGFSGTGEATDARTRAELLDESLAILIGLWTGEPFEHHGHHYQLREMTFRPPPIQRPRIPIWVVGAWPRERSMRRAVRYDGILPNVLDAAGAHQAVEPDHVREIAAYAAERSQQPDFEIVMEGSTRGDDPAAAAAITDRWAAAGATWWLESDWSSATVDSIRTRIRQGPPRPPPA